MINSLLVEKYSNIINLNEGKCKLFLSIEAPNHVKKDSAILNINNPIINLENVFINSFFVRYNSYFDYDF